MKCNIAAATPYSDSFNIWLFTDGPRRGVLRFTDAGIAVEAVPEGSIVEPTLTLPSDALEALARAAAGVIPATDATSAHLADARGTRDRLLTLVEHVIERP